MDSLRQYEVEIDNLRSNSIHAPPGPRPLRAGAHPLTKSQVTAERKAAKELKAKALEERKIAVAARQATAAAKKQAKQDALVASAKAKVAKALAKTEGLRATASGHHLTKKTKGDSGGFTLVADEPGVPKQSPQRQATTNKRISLHSPLRSPIRPLALAEAKKSGAIGWISERVRRKRAKTRKVRRREARRKEASVTPQAARRVSWIR
jgi:hypothetical protein